MKTNIRDIARRAGVSTATVSNALNDRRGVSEENKKRILSIAHEMGYEYVPPALNERYIRLVIFKRSGKVIMDTQFFMEMMDAISRQCQENHLNLMVTNIHLEKDANYPATIRAICREDCAGLLLLATEMLSADIEPFLRAVSPVLALDSDFPLLPIDTVSIANEQAGYLAGQWLATMGHKRIGHITSSFHFSNMKYRRQGWENALCDAGIEPRADDILRVEPTIEGAYNDMRTLLKARPGDLPTAFFVANDIIAAGCVRAIKEAGLKIPADVSIIGMDDLELCQISNPPLTTIRVPKAGLARAAVRRLMEMSARDAEECVLKTMVGVELIERKSILDKRE